MKLATSDMISKIDAYSAEKLAIPTLELMKKSGIAVADAVRKRVPEGSRVVILAGGGNNGGDGYAAAVELIEGYSVLVFDVFSRGQKSEAGKHFLERYKSLGGEVRDYDPCDRTVREELLGSDCIVDAVFGTGFKGEMPESIRPLAVAIRDSVGVHKIAVDVPLGINPDDGTVSEFAITASATVALSFIKPGIISYPARSYVGEIIYASLGLPEDKLEEEFSFKYNMIEQSWACEHLPNRDANSNKGSFGKLLMITGSEKFRGAAHLSLATALRGGVGLVSYLGCEELVSELSAKYPEAVYHKTNIDNTLTDEEIENICLLSGKHSATLLGSGSDNTEGLLRLTLALLAREGGPLILDADALNALSLIGEEGTRALKLAKREVVLTPHPLEFSRLSGKSVAQVQQARLESAESFVRDTGVTLVLKGAGTIISSPECTHINVAGSSALAKAGSGDVLAGLIGAFVAEGGLSVSDAAALAVYMHAVAGEELAKIYSSYGVTPSDLPIEIAKVLARHERNK